MSHWSVALLAFLLSFVGTLLMRTWALGTGLLDVPNARSAHLTPTARGGGTAIVLSTSIALGILTAMGKIEADLYLGLGVGGLAVAVVGFLDDRYQISPWIRLVVHFGAAIWALSWLGGMPPVRWGEQTMDLGIFGDLLALIGIVWSLNLFNFMDGIDGIAASEAAFVCLCGAGLGIYLHVPEATISTAVVIGAASLGFLAWNWPPAKIFMGDVGSGYLGFVIAVLALASGRANGALLWAWLTLFGVFLTDATLTLIHRLGRRERVYEPHRTHAYQWLARRWSSHRRVTVAVLMINVFWLLPCASIAASQPSFAGWIVAIALIPVGVIAALAGAGRAESLASGASPGSDKQ